MKLLIFGENITNNNAMVKNAVNTAGRKMDEDMNTVSDTYTGWKGLAETIDLTRALPFKYVLGCYLVFAYLYLLY